MHVAEKALSHFLKLALCGVDILRLFILDEVVLRETTENHLVVQLLRWLFCGAFPALMAEVDEFI